jgi:hypothetical protein
MTERRDTSPCRLTDEQAEEVRRRQRDFAAGRERYATDEEVAALWKKAGLRGFGIGGAPPLRRIAARRETLNRCVRQ